MKRLAILACSVALVASPSRAGDFARDRLDNWHQWRGPLANGVAPKGDPPTRWDEKTNVKWKVPIPGDGSSTPAVWGDRIFVLTAIDTGRVAAPRDLPKEDERFPHKTRAPRTYHRFVVLCIDRRTGRTRWRRTAAEQVPHEGHHPTHSYAAASPTTDGRLLFASFGSRGIYCYDLDGNLKWQRDLGVLHTRLGWGEGSSPTLAGDTLIANWDQEGHSFIAALDARTGKDRWRKDRDEKTSWNTPLVVRHNGRDQVVVNGTKRVRSYDLKTGDLLWECGGQTVNPIPSPVATDRLAICVSGYRGSAAFAVPLDARGDVTGTDKIAWQYHKGTPYVPSPLLDGNRLYFTQMNNPILTCLDARTGKPLIDRKRLPSLNTLYASPVAAGDNIYIVDRDGTTLVLRRGVSRVEVRAVNRLDDAIDASPVVVGRQLLLRGHKHLYCIEAAREGASGKAGAGGAQPGGRSGSVRP